MISCPILSTERLLIRPISISDHFEFYKLLTNPIISEIAGIDSNIELENIKDSIQYFESLNATGYYYKWAICLKNGAKFIGECEMYPLKPQVRPWFEWSIGFTLNPEFWRNGFMYEALSKIIDYGFNNFEIHRIKADVHTFNIPSNKLLEKLQFKLEGVQKSKILLNKKYFNMNLMALTKNTLNE
jgi:ribosomal-protein-alanine N-acetyltransferase